MYNHAGVAGGSAAVGSLPFTGINVVWMVLAAFALVAAGSALLRIAPRRER